MGRRMGGRRSGGRRSRLPGGRRRRLSGGRCRRRGRFGGLGRGGLARSGCHCAGVGGFCWGAGRLAVAGGLVNRFVEGFVERLVEALGRTLAGPLSGAGLPPPNDSRNRRATGASTVDDADLTNSPCSFSRARTSLLVTPSSLANSCTRALPATTSPVYEATVVGRASGLAMTHCHRDFTVCSCSLLPVLLTVVSSSLKPLTCSTTADVSGEPAMRSALVKARRRIACCTHCGTGCSHAPRPGRLPAVSTITAKLPFPVDTATTRSSSTASSRFRHPTHVRTGPSVCLCAKAEGSRWITAQSSVT